MPSKPLNRATVLTFSCLAVLMSAGCRHVPSATYEFGRSVPAAADPRLEPDESGLMLGELDRSGRALSALAVWSPQPRTRIYRRFQDGPDQRVFRTSRPVGVGDQRQNMIEVRAASEETPGTRTLLALTGDGVFTLRNDSGGVSSVFDPGALFLPTELQSGGVAERSFDVRSSGSLIGEDSAGSGVVRIEGMGRQPIGTPAGLFEAFVLETELAMTVGAARILFSRRLWIDDAFGLVAEIGRDRVTVFGVPVRTREWVSVAEGEDDRRR
ncbi:MAG: hypothetical protein AAGA55_06120 [Planctomycetota bacterium]